VSQTRLFGLGGHFINRNPDDLTLLKGEHKQTGLRSDFNYIVDGSHQVEGGLYVRRVQGRGSERRYSPVPASLFEFARHANQQGYYLQDTWRQNGLALSLTGGARIDHLGITGETVVTPRAALSFAPLESTRVRLGWGQHAEFPGFGELFGRGGNSSLRAERATHYSASVEYLFDHRTRMVAEFYDREEKGLFFSLAEPLIESGRLAFISFPFRNSLRGYGRGFEVTLHRRTANRLTGWISYSHSRTRLSDRMTGLTFVSDFDQRHTLSAYGSYRLTNTLNLSGLWRYGSGLPFVGFFRESNGVIVFGSERNRLRLPAYSRVDLRINKAFYFKRSKLTLSGEVLNLLNRRNLRQDGRQTEKLLPLTPSVGIALEF
jgi:outer membrane receptor protein involved in Fe transport